MRKLWLVLAATMLIAGQTHAAALPFTGSIALQIATLSPITVTGSGTATVNGSTGGAHVSSLALPAGIAGPVTINVPITDPLAFPIAGLIAAGVSNGPGNFSGGSTPGSPLNGTMAVLGISKVCLFAPCTSPAANLSVPLSAIGVGGTKGVSTFVNITVVGAPWTQGTAAIGTITQMGFVHGPASGTSSTAAASGLIRLVTPVFISTNLPASAVVPAFGSFTLHLVPEPGTLVLLGSGIAGLLIFGRSRPS